MKYDYYNLGYYSQIENINLNNKLSTTENTELTNYYYISEHKEDPPSFNSYNIYNIYNHNNPDNFNNNQNFFQQNINEPKPKKNIIIKEEIKNVEYNDEYYQNYNYIPKNFNDSNSKNLKDKNIICNNNSIYNRKKSLYDYINYNKKDHRSIKILNLNNINKNDSSFNIFPSRNLFYKNNLTDNKIDNNSFNKYNISPIKNNNLFPDIKCKQQIIYIKRDISCDNTKKKNEDIEPIFSKPNIPGNDHHTENYNSSDKKVKNKNNHINIIPVPKISKKFQTFENRKNLFSTKVKKENIKKKRNGSTSIKKKIINIDINVDYDDYDKNNQNMKIHKKNKSLLLGKNFILTNNNFNNNKINKVNNIQLIKKSPESPELYICHNEHNSEKHIRQKVKNKIPKGNLYNELKGRIWEEVNIKKRISKAKFIQMEDMSYINNIHNVINNNKLPEKFKISWGGKSQAGKDSKGKIKINQDAFNACENVNDIKNFNIFILCDGHGNDGHYVSKFVTKYIVYKISNHPVISLLKDLEDIYKKLIEKNYKIIKEIFSETDIYLLDQKQFDTYTSGTTCVLILQIGNKIICANSGDSRAILIYNSDFNNNNDQLNNTKIFPLSLDSKPDLPSEIKRIINCGGEVHKKKNRKGKYVGPMRVYAKGKDFPGLAMSRSLGDFKSKEYGVINEPSFAEHILDELCKYIVVCSDGVWDFMDNEKVMKIGNKHYINNNPNGFCEEVLGNASYWWEKEDVVIDDITALIVFFKF